MSKNPFIVLGVDENTVTQNELFEAYKTLRNHYSDLRFEAGDKGADACVRLEEVEAAYQAANEQMRSRYNIGYTGDVLDEADDLIKQDKLSDAQDILDNCQNRTAKWHYLQAAIFYRKHWMADALKQLEFACSMEPQNAKYQDARQTLLNKINATTSQKNASFYGHESKEGERTYTNIGSNGGGRRGVSACDCCTSLICADCCCECMGGDLIACC